MFYTVYQASFLVLKIIKHLKILQLMAGQLSNIMSVCILSLKSGKEKFFNGLLEIQENSPLRSFSSAREPKQETVAQLR